MDLLAKAAASAADATAWVAYLSAPRVQGALEPQPPRPPPPPPPPPLARPSLAKLLEVYSPDDEAVQMKYYSSGRCQVLSTYAMLLSAYAIMRIRHAIAFI